LNDIEDRICLYEILISILRTLGQQFPQANICEVVPVLLMLVFS